MRSETPTSKERGRAAGLQAGGVMIADAHMAKSIVARAEADEKAAEAVPPVAPEAVSAEATAKKNALLEQLEALEKEANKGPKAAGK